MKVVVVVSTNFQHCVQAFLLLLEIWNFCITTVQLILFFPLSFRLFFYRTEKKCRNGSSLPPPQVFPRLSERRKRETTKQQAREEDDGNDRRARAGSDERWAFSSLPITSFVRAFLHNREFIKAATFWSDAHLPEVDFLHSWAAIFNKFLGKSSLQE